MRFIWDEPRKVSCIIYAIPDEDGPFVFIRHNLLHECPFNPFNI